VSRAVTFPSVGRGLAVLVAIASALALASCGGGGDTTIVKSIVSEPTTSTATTTTTSSSTTVPAHLAHYRSFQSASGDIGCAASGGTVRCDIQKRSWNPPPRPASCPDEVDFGQGIEVGSGRAQFVCAGDTTLNPSAPKLPPGRATSSGDIDCTAIANLITCTNQVTGHGFAMSGASYKLF
jgi:hypothetical protein